jgi:hypothetical protein
VIRGELISLLQRLVELLTRLFNERMELARGELHEGARRAVWVFAGGLFAAMGLAFFGAAAVEALAPLVRSRALRLCLVALPLFGAGAAILLRVSAPRHAHDHGQQRHRQDHVRQAAEGIAAHQPQQQQ